MRAAMQMASKFGATNFAAAACSEVPVCAEAGVLYQASAPSFGLEYSRTLP
jgi:hypothetical protein